MEWPVEADGQAGRRPVFRALTGESGRRYDRRMINRRAAIASLSSLPVLAGTKAFGAPLSPPQALLWKEGRYLHEYLRAKAALETAKGQDLAVALELFGMIAAMVGDEDGALSSWARAYPPKRTSAPDLSRFAAEDAVEAIARAAVGRRVVILNEAHYSSRCRAFAADLAERLAQDGFAFFAAETFTPNHAAAKLNNGAPLTTDIGYYTDDPQFANMVRRARTAHLTFCEYEQTEAQQGGPASDQIATREEAEATNLIGNVLSKSPNGRVFVYCGYHHAAKAPLGANTWMAARLKQKTGVDPLCIDQTNGLPHYDLEEEAAEMTAVLARFAPNRPIVVRTPEGAPYALGEYGGAVDFAVYHPRLPKVDGRPGWLASGPRQRLEVALPNGRKDQALLQAVPAAEASAAANVVPADQTLVGAGARTGVLFLPPGGYELRLETLSGVTPLGARSIA